MSGLDLYFQQYNGRQKQYLYSDIRIEYSHSKLHSY